MIHPRPGLGDCGRLGVSLRGVVVSRMWRPANRIGRLTEHGEMMSRSISGWELMSWGSLLLLSCGGRQSTSVEHGGATSSAGGDNFAQSAGDSSVNARGGQSAMTDSGGAAPFDAGGAEPEPADPRPARPLWDPPLQLGTPGWQGSHEPLCERHRGAHQAFDVWADQRGVFVLLSETCNALAGEECGSEALTVQFNDGSGWQSIYRTEPTSNLHLRGLPGGNLMLVGMPCGISLLEPNGRASCSTSLQGLPPADATATDANSAYAIDDERVLAYAKGAWTVRATLPSAGEAISAAPGIVAIAGFNQAVYVDLGDGFRALPDVPAGDYASVWAFGPSDIWLGNRVGQLVHYDGAAFEVIPTGATNAIDGLWGADGQLFFRTWSDFGRWNGKSIEILFSGAGPDADNPRLEVGGLWGRSAKEVFVTLVDAKFEPYACGEHFVVWFDGARFHEF